MQASIGDRVCSSHLDLARYRVGRQVLAVVAIADSGDSFRRSLGDDAAASAKPGSSMIVATASKPETTALFQGRVGGPR